MRSFFAPNLDRRGRIVRGVSGIVLILSGLVVSPYTNWACSALVLAGGFVLYEAARGWCLVRACGLKTRV